MRDITDIPIALSAIRADVDCLSAKTRILPPATSSQHPHCRPCALLARCWYRAREAWGTCRLWLSYCIHDLHISLKYCLNINSPYLEGGGIWLKDYPRNRRLASMDWLLTIDYWRLTPRMNAGAWKEKLTIFDWRLFPTHECGSLLIFSHWSKKKSW